MPMITADFLATVILVSASGVLGPGPLFLASTLRATRIGTVSGLQCAIGHTVVEAPIVFGLAFGLSAILNPTSIKLIGIAGGSVLLVFGTVQLLQAYSGIESSSKSLPDIWKNRSGVFLGILFTGLNPFFILWWLTVGSALISQAILLGALGGVALMYASHIWMDYAWLGGTAAVAARGRVLLGRWLRMLLVIRRSDGLFRGHIHSFGHGLDSEVELCEIFHFWPLRSLGLRIDFIGCVFSQNSGRVQMGYRLYYKVEPWLIV